MVMQTQSAQRALSGGSRRGIQSVETGLRVLAALAAADGPSTLTSIGLRSGLSPSQTHRYLQSLMGSGMAVQDASSRYDLGPAVIRIGIAAVARLNSFSRAEDMLRRFAEDTGWTVSLSVWGESGPVCVRWLPGHPPVVTSMTVGSRLPLLFSAAGWVFLTFISESELSGPLGAALAETSHLPNLQEIRDSVLRTLVAEIEPPTLPGLRSIAAPIFDLQGRVLVVATAMCPSAYGRANEPTVVARFRAACRDATISGGGIWPGD